MSWIELKTECYEERIKERKEKEKKKERKNKKERKEKERKKEKKKERINVAMPRRTNWDKILQIVQVTEE